MVRMFILTLVICLATVGQVSAANPKGVAAVLLPNWTTTDADLLVKAVVDSKVSEFEFSFWATYPGSRGYAIPQRVVNGLLAKNVKVRVRVFLGVIHDRTANPNLWSQAIAFNSAMVVPYKNDARVSFRVSPALEDEYPDQSTWEGAARAALKRIDTAAYPRLKMVRCTTLYLSDNKTLRTGGRISIPATVNSGAGNVGCEAECHWRARTGSVAYSNDGQFVYIGSERFLNSGTSFAGTRTLDAFKSDGSAFGGSQMLWRPSYNLHPSDNAKTNRTFDGQFSLATRLDGQAPAFDAYEAQVLKSFLQ